MALLDDVAARLLAQDLEDRVTGLALAACGGRAAVEAALLAPPDLPDLDGGQGTEDAPAVHLRSIRVTGFRGIGASSILELPPGPGLTLVVGRNGSGKSSFAEAVEFALTGDNRRWSKRSKVWRDGWRNLHHDGDAEVAAEFAVEGLRAPTVVRRHWTPEAALDEATLSVTKAADLEELGWTQALELHRPFLPYSELGAMVDDGPTALHDALSAVLGLDLLTDAAKALKDARLERERAWKQAVKDASSLADELADVDDPRAREAVDLLRLKAPDVDAIAALLGDAPTGTDPALDVLRQLTGIAGPDLDAVRHAADRLDDAARAVAAERGTEGARDLAAAELLRSAQAFHLHHGDGACPVCGVGELDPTWAQRASQLETDLRSAAKVVADLAASREAARHDVAALARAVPAVLHRAGVADVDASLAVQTWEDLEAVAAIEDDRDRALALRKSTDAVTNSLADLRTRAKAALLKREDRWRPHATHVAGWVDKAERARHDVAPVAFLKAAEVAVTRVHDEVRAQRWSPIADQAKQIWEGLRQSSNVSIEDVALAGAGNRRRVEVTVTVDGVAGAALGVMSQGELHALALSLFLPRATLEESPFRFLVIDDPVQSMDPARVDGLARVLQDVAKDRQVVVFTHDDRLPEAVRRLQVAANVLEVSRGPASVVSVRHASSPWERHLDDARALARSEDLADILRQRTVPGFCRLAIEAACADAVRRTELAAGRTHAEVEAELDATPKLLPRLALALLGDGAKGGEVYAHLNRKPGAWATDIVRACNAGAHTGSTADLRRMVDEVDELIAKALR